MAIIQQPDAISMSGNMKKFIVSSGSQITFSLTDDGTVLLEATYEPGIDGRATIDVRDIVESRLTYTLLSTNFYEQASIAKTFVATIDGTPVSFRVIRAGVAQLADTVTNWLRGNFLTWQPTNKQVTYYSPEWLTYYAQEECNIMLKATFPDDTVQNINLGACEAGKAFTCNLQYAVIAGMLGQVYPSYYDVWVESTNGTRLTYVQRYLYSELKSELEQWFLFENSLGGIDTIRAYGDTDLLAKHEHKLSSVDDISSEYNIDTERSYNKNTGYLNEYDRRWLLDFFPSQKKYIYHQGTIRPIVVSESDVKYTASDLPSSYSFVYRFTADQESDLLNLIRNQEDIPESITIPNIDSPDFSLPPRLSEYPRVQLHGGVIIPAFDPNSSTPTVTTLASIIEAAMRETIETIPGSGTGGQLVNILKTLDASPATDENVFSSLRVLAEILDNNKVLNDIFLSKLHPDTAEEVITFMKGIKIGIGGRIDENGNGELRSLRLWEFLEVPELRYNRAEVFTGINWQTFGAGIIESVEIDKDAYGHELQSGVIHLKLEEGEIGKVAVDDMCQGIYHNFGGENDTVSEDQRNGNFHIQGFRTSYFRITEILDTATNGQFRYVLRGTSERWSQLNHPSPYMHFACYANPSNPDRQACSYSTTEYSIRLHNMTTWEYGENNIYAIDGKLDGFKLGETVFTGTGQVIGNGYFYGYIQSIENAPYELKIENGGDNFLAFGESMEILCKVFKGLNDVTSEVEEWSVTRESGNQAEDDAWNIAHHNFAGQITLQHNASYSDIGDGISTLFRFVASGGSDTAILELTI